MNKCDRNLRMLVWKRNFNECVYFIFLKIGMVMEDTSHNMTCNLKFWP